jgi:hypothetical protein
MKCPECAGKISQPPPDEPKECVCGWSEWQPNYCEECEEYISEAEYDDDFGCCARCRDKMLEQMADSK